MSWIDRRETEDVDRDLRWAEIVHSCREVVESIHPGMTERSEDAGAM